MEKLDLYTSDQEFVKYLNEHGYHLEDACGAGVVVFSVVDESLYKVIEEKKFSAEIRDTKGSFVRVYNKGKPLSDSELENRLKGLSK
ncbi:MAG: hypothetical protein QXU88_01835 [Candidatus Woesearchaeota archaeon]